MAPSASLPFIVAGGRIGGLATALGLARRGIAVTVLEKAAVGEQQDTASHARAAA